MIKVDGLESTEEFKEYIEKEKRGEVTMAPIGIKVNAYRCHNFIQKDTA